MKQFAAPTIGLRRAVTRESLPAWVLEIPRALHLIAQEGATD